MPIVAIPQLFAILAQSNFDKIDAAIKAKYPNDYLALGPGQWLIVAAGTTTKEMSDALGVTTGESGSAVLIAGTGGYFGRGNPGTW